MKPLKINVLVQYNGPGPVDISPEVQSTISEIAADLALKHIKEFGYFDTLHPKCNTCHNADPAYKGTSFVLCSKLHAYMHVDKYCCYHTELKEDHQNILPITLDPIPPPQQAPDDIDLAIYSNDPMSLDNESSKED